MSTRRKIFLNTTVRWIGEILGKILWFGFMVVCARLMGVKEFGYFSYALTYAGLLIILTDFGTNTYLIKAVSKNTDRTEYYIKNVLAAKFYLSILCLVVCGIIAIATKVVWQSLLLFTLALVIASYLDPINSVYRAHKQMHYESLVMFLWRFLIVVPSVIGLYLFKFGMINIALTLIISSFVGLSISMFISSKSYSIDYFSFKNIKLDVVKEVIKKSFPIAIIMVIGGFILKFNTVLIQYLRSPEEVGYYSAAYKIVEGLFFVPSIFISSVFPFLCERNYKKAFSESGRKLLYKSIAILLFLTVCVAALIELFSHRIILILYGEEFIDSLNTLRILIWVVVFTGLNEIMYFSFLSIDKIKSQIVIISISLLIYVACSLTFISAYGPIGGAISLIISQMVIFVLNIILFLKTKKRSITPSNIDFVNQVV